ncbi:MAG TPA: TetR/AcrR family transcriptional regulator [Kineosporiaceae bacterium]|nr:TetR/AcrR family transcriptional regulator [Kineosporiaceae bacterium]
MPEPERPPLSIWQRPERAGRGPAPEHSRASIAAAGLAVADAEGLAAITMRRVATAIGTAPASLYRYVANRDELTALMADAALSEMPLTDLPTDAGWRADVLTLAERLRALYRRHPWLLDLMMRPGPAMLGPAAVDYLEGGVAALSELDAPARTKLEAVSVLTGMVSMFVKDELGAGNVSEQAQAANAAYLGSIVAAGNHPHLAAVMMQAAADPTAGGAPDPGQIFKRLVVGVMSGLLAPPALP